MIQTKQTARRSTGGKAPPSMARDAARRATEAEACGKVAVKRRYRPGKVALRDIRKFQRSGDLQIIKLPFQRLLRDIAQEYTNVLLSSQFWPMWAKSRRGLGQLPVGQSTLSG